MHTRIRRGFGALAIAALLLAASTAAAGDSADDIINDALDTNATSFQSGIAQMTLITEDKAGDRKTRRLATTTKDTGEGQRSLVRLLEPDEVKGQAFLFKENKAGEDMVYWYLPAFGVTRRIAGEGKKGSFMGTHMTYADFESRDIKDATYKRLKDEKIGTTEVFVIEATPKKTADSDYGKVVVYVRKSDRIPLKVRFFDKSGQPAKVLFVEKLDKQGERTIVKQMTIRPASGGFTRLIVDAIDLDKDIPDVLFTPEALANE